MIFSCNRLFFPYPYSSEDNTGSFGKSLILISDTTLNYSIRFGGLGIATTIKYKILDSLLVIDSIDIYGRRAFQEITSDVFNHQYLFSKDSLIDLENNDKFFGKKYFNNLQTKRNKNRIYLIMNNEKIRINRYNVKKLFFEIDTTKQEIVLAEPAVLIKFGIKPKSIVYEVINK